MRLDDESVRVAIEHIQRWCREEGTYVEVGPSIVFIFNKKEMPTTDLAAAAAMAAAPVRRGRPPGSKNKPKLGRPKGSKNKPKRV